MKTKFLAVSLFLMATSAMAQWGGATQYDAINALRHLDREVLTLDRLVSQESHTGYINTPYYINQYQQEIRQLINAINYYGRNVRPQFTRARDAHRNLRITINDENSRGQIGYRSYQQFTYVHQLQSDVFTTVADYMNGQGQGGRRWECTAVDVHTEEHGHGHLGSGNSQQQAAHNALNNCRRYHHNCQIRRCDSF